MSPGSVVHRMEESSAWSQRNKLLIINKLSHNSQHSVFCLCIHRLQHTLILKYGAVQQLKSLDFFLVLIFSTDWPCFWSKLAQATENQFEMALLVAWYMYSLWLVNVNLNGNLGNGLWYESFSEIQINSLSCTWILLLPRLKSSWHWI